MKISHTNILVL